MRKEILSRLENNGELPTLPDIVLKLQKMLQDPHSNAHSIARIIEVDPVLAGRILNIANSVYSVSYTHLTLPTN